MINGGVRVDDAHVFYGTIADGFGEVVRITKAGYARTVLAPTYSIYGLHLGATYVYYDKEVGPGPGWVIYRVPKNGGASDKCGEYQPGYEEDDWDADDRGVVVRTKTKLIRYPASCSGAPATTALVGKKASHVALDATTAFVVVDDRLFAAPRAGGAPKMLAPCTAPPVPFGDSVFFSMYEDDAGGSIRRVAKTGGAVTTLMKNELGARNIAVDATHVYWTAGEANVLYRVARTGGAPEMLGTLGAAARGDIFLDDESIYWIDDDRTSIKKAPK